MCVGTALSAAATVVTGSESGNEREEEKPRGPMARAAFAGRVNTTPFG